MSTPIDVIPEERTLLGYKMSNLLLFFFLKNGFLSIAAESEMSTVARIIHFNAAENSQMNVLQRSDRLPCTVLVQLSLFLKCHLTQTHKQAKRARY